MIPPIYHSLRRESIKNTNSASAIGVKSVRPTRFEDIVTTKEPASHAGQEQPEPMHGLKLGVKEEHCPEREAGIPSTSRTGQTRFARSGHIELQTSANQPESLDRCTDAWHNC